MPILKELGKGGFGSVFLVKISDLIKIKLANEINS